MESTVRSPQAGDNVLVLAKMNSGRLTEFSGCIEEVSADYAYFALDSIHLIGAKMRPATFHLRERCGRLMRLVCLELASFLKS
jgi:hypothetical protein